MIYSGWKFILFLVFGGMSPTSYAELSQFALKLSVKNCHHFLVVRQSSVLPGNHKSEEHEAESSFLKNKNFVFVTFRLPQVN